MLDREHTLGREYNSQNIIQRNWTVGFLCIPCTATSINICWANTDHNLRGWMRDISFPISLNFPWNPNFQCFWFIVIFSLPIVTNTCYVKTTKSSSRLSDVSLFVQRYRPCHVLRWSNFQMLADMKMHDGFGSWSLLADILGGRLIYESCVIFSRLWPLNFPLPFWSISKVGTNRLIVRIQRQASQGSSFLDKVDISQDPTLI